MFEQQKILNDKILEGLELEKQNHFIQAIACYFEVLNIDFSHYEAHQSLAEVFIKQGKIKEAKFHLEQTLKLKNKLIQSDNLNSEFSSEILLASQVYTEVENILSSKQQSINNNLESNFSYTGSSSCITKLSEKQPHEINQIVKQSDEKVITLPDKDYLLNQKNLPTQNEKTEKILLEQALLFYEDKQWARAIATCQNVLKKSPSLAEAHKIWGNCLQQQGEFSEAIEHYARAIEVNPDFYEVYINIGSIFAKRGQKDKALDYYTQALRINPRFAGVHRNLARLWEELNDLDKAEYHLFQAINLEPKTLSVQQHIQLAQELIKEGKKAQALSCCHHAIQLEPKFQSGANHFCKNRSINKLRRHY